MLNKIIIVGGDHHNGLGLARILGINGCEVHCMVITDKNKSWIAKSKYVKESHLFKKEKDAFDYVIKHYIDHHNKSFLIPYSDGAAYELDSRLNEFNSNFFVPSIKDLQGEIVKMMDKERQYQFAKENKIFMAKSVLLHLSDVDVNLIEDDYFPCILKPNMSAQGDKRDIRICQNRCELKNSISELHNIGYEQILLQQFLEIDYEIVIVGALMNNDIVFSANKVIRTHAKGGTNSFSQTIIDEDILEKCQSILQKIKGYGFNGLIDVEVFMINEELYLNEINWRNSGGVFRSISSGFYYPYWWVEDCLKICDPAMKKWKPQDNEFSMTEHGDIRNVLNKKISLFQWLKDKRKTKNFALKLKGDMKPAFCRYLYFVRQILFKKKI